MYIRGRQPRGVKVTLKAGDAVGPPSSGPMYIHIYINTYVYMIIWIYILYIYSERYICLYTATARGASRSRSRPATRSPPNPKIWLRETGNPNPETRKKTRTVGLLEGGQGHPLPITRYHEPYTIDNEP